MLFHDGEWPWGGRTKRHGGNLGPRSSGRAGRRGLPPRTRRPHLPKPSDNTSMATVVLLVLLSALIVILLLALTAPTKPRPSHSLHFATARPAVEVG
jgi:hypothetical protein